MSFKNVNFYKLFKLFYSIASRPMRSSSPRKPQFSDFYINLFTILVFNMDFSFSLTLDLLRMIRMHNMSFEKYNLGIEIML